MLRLLFTFDPSGLPIRRALLQPHQRLFQLRDDDGVLAARHPFLEVVHAVDQHPQDFLIGRAVCHGDERTIILFHLVDELQALDRITVEFDFVAFQFVCVTFNYT